MTIKHLLSFGRSALVACIVFIGIGCSLSEAGVGSHLPPDKFFSVLDLEHSAINLSTIAPYDTVTLRTVAILADGSPVPGEIIYSVSDPAISITNNVLKAVSAISDAVVRVTHTYGTVTRTDSAIVSVITMAPGHLDEFGFQVPATDSAKVALGGLKTIQLIRRDEFGSDLSGLSVALQSSDTTVATISRTGSSLNITSQRPGRVMLYASTFAYGIEKKDSLLFTVGWPLVFHIPIVEKFMAASSIKILDFTYQNLTIGVGGCVVWTSRNLQLDIDVKFDDTTHVVSPATCQYLLIADRSTGGNIAPYRAIAWDGTDEGYFNFIFSPYKARTFSSAGIYQFESLIHGTKGRVRVCNENSDATCAPQGIGAWY